MTGQPESQPALLPVPKEPPIKGAFGRWLMQPGVEEGHAVEQTYPWYAVLWLTGVDYFSTLGYQPGIALLATGALSPLATLLLVGVTLFGALPVYYQVTRRSFIGQGSIAMLENLLPSWWGKLFVLALLGFASTSFVITMTLSASDAAEHLVKNPLLVHYLEGWQLPVTLVLLALLAVVFLLGFSEAVGLAVAVGVPYILLNFAVIVRGLFAIAEHPEVLGQWQGQLALQGDWPTLLVLTVFAFPKLALGLSGFETGVSVMPLVRGNPDDDRKPIPEGRIDGSRRLLTAAALLMGVLLIGSSLVTTVLIPPTAYAEGGEAAGRTLAYLSHRLLGEVFGTIYDISTIAILWFAGASAMVGMLNLIPRYLPRFGMAPAWVSYNRPLVLVLLLVNVLVTCIFRADVEAQGGAYATGVLALILSAAVAVALALGRESQQTGQGSDRLLSLYFWAVSLVFAYALIANIVERPDGVIISALFIFAILVIGSISRLQRSTELRVETLAFRDSQSAALWPELRGRKVHLVPTRSFDCDDKIAQIRKLYITEGPLALLRIKLVDDRSDFLSGLRLGVDRTPEGIYRIEVEGAVALANTIAYLSELIDPISIFLQLKRKNFASQLLEYLLFGEGETGFIVYQILVQYWDWTPEEDLRPHIFLLSD